MVCFRAESAIRVASRRWRVSSFFALKTQRAQVRRYHGGWAWKKAQAVRFLLSST